MQQLKDKALQKTYEDLFYTFGTPGWAFLMKKAEELRKQADTVRRVEDLRELGMRQGEVRNLDWLLGYAQACEYAYTELLRDEGQDADAPATPGKAEVIE